MYGQPTVVVVNKSAEEYVGYVRVLSVSTV